MGVVASGGTESTVDGYKIHKFTADLEKTVALLHFNGDNNSTTFTDETGKTWTRSGDAHIYTGEKKFGSASGYFDGNGDNIHTADHADFEFGSGDFTIDLWVKSTQTSQYANLISKDNTWAGSTGQWCLLTSGSSPGSIQFYCYNYNIFSGPMLDTAGSLFNTGSWVHIALVRYGNVWTLYVNGVSRATRTSATTIASSVDDVYVGMHQFYSRPYLGYIDELRISKGIARWTADFSDDLPTSEHKLDNSLTVTTGGDVEVIVVAGGGAGGTWYGGGGGAGGVLYEAAHAVTSQEYNIVVGSGAPRMTANGQGEDGNDSTFNTLTAIKGGGGGNYTIENGRDGGSGGGVAHGTAGTAGTGVVGPPRQGYNGGTGSSADSSGGGGGAGGIGGTSGGASHVGGVGGVGVSTYSDLLIAADAGVDISGVHWIAGGGAGWGMTTTPALGGNGGGGVASRGDDGGTGQAGDGVVNTGSGGGGAWCVPYGYLGGAGGSGIVIIRYLSTVTVFDVPEPAAATIVITNIVLGTAVRSAADGDAPHATGFTFNGVEGTETVEYIESIDADNSVSATIESLLDNISASTTLGATISTGGDYKESVTATSNMGSTIVGTVTPRTVLTETINDSIFMYDTQYNSWLVSVSEALGIADTISNVWGISISEWLTLVDSERNNWNGRDIVSDGFTIYDLTGPGKIFQDTITESIIATDTTTYKLTVMVLEFLVLSELVSGLNRCANMSSESLILTDSPYYGFNQSITEALALIDTNSVITLFLNAIAESLVLADTNSVVRTTNVSASESLIFVDTISNLGRFYSTIQETLALNIEVFLSGEVWQCYVLNTPNFYPSMYSGFNFNSYCVSDNRAYGANDTGIFELTGNTDAGTTIHTGVILSKTDFGLPHQKRFRRGYLGVSGTAPVMVFEAENGEREAFTVDTEGKIVGTHDLKSKKWVISVADYDTLDHIKLVPIILTR